MLRIFLNGVLAANPPKELDQIDEELFLDRQLHGYLYQIRGSITFIGDDYDTLRALYDSEYCQDVEIDVQYSDDFGGVWVSKIKGLIKLSDCKWNRISNQVECPITDNSFLSKINNNKNIEFTLGRSDGNVLSKNGVDVQYKLVTQPNIFMFSPFRGRYFFNEASFTKGNPPFPASEGDDLVDMTIAGRTGIFIYDALNLVIAMMTDDDVDFESDYFSYDLVTPSNSRDEAFAAIFSGQCLRHGSGYPTISFFDLFDDLHKLCNVWFGLEYTSAGKPRIRIEDEDYFRQTNSLVYFDSVESMLESIALDRIYSRIVLGCSQSGGGDFPVGEVGLVMHVQEEFPLSGNCNLDNELNLQLGKLIINTNSISKALPSISGFSNGGSIKRKYTNEQTQAGPNQQITDSNASYQESLISNGFLIRNTRENTWSYLTGVPDNNNILIEDQIFIVDNTGATKDYEIYKPSDDDSFFKDVFLIQIDKVPFGIFDYMVAFQTEITPPSDLFYYNEIFNNANTITRHLGAISQTIVNTLTDGNDEFEAGNSVSFIISNTTYLLAVNNTQYKRIRFNDEVTPPYFDTNGNYDALTGIYTAPQSGYYQAYADLQITNNAASGDDYTQQVEMCRVSVGGDVIESESAFTTILNGTSFTFNLDRVFYLEAGETIQVFIKKRFGLAGIYLNQYVDWSIDAVGYGPATANDLVFGVDAVFNGGGLVPVGTPNEARILNIEGGLTVERDVFDSILLNPYKYYHLNYGITNYMTGYIDKITRGILNGETTLTLFKKKNGV